MPIEPQNRDIRHFDDLQQEGLGNYIYALRHISRGVFNIDNWHEFNNI